MQPWLKAGLIGAAVLAAVNLLGGLVIEILPVTCCLGLLIYFGIGLLTAYWMPQRQTGPAAGQGAMAAALAALIGGVIYAIVITISFALVDTTSVINQLPADIMQPYEQLGIDPTTFMGPIGGALWGSTCCITWMILAAILGAFGGVLFAAIQSE